MSIIEKAVDKLERAKPDSEQKSEPSARLAGDTLEKLVVAKTAEKGAAVECNEQPPQLVTATPVVDPVGPAPSSAVAAEVLELPFAKLSARGILTPLTPRSAIAEEFRTIKRPLLRNIDGALAAPVSNVNLVMVTSALQGDGKTFTAINLAISIALEQDKTVLFVDADVAKAGAGALLGVPSRSKGLIDVLEDKDLSLADVMLPTNIENLKILPAGNLHERATELLASRSMKELMLEMASRYSDRVVVFDSPPLLLTTEASVLASFMGQIAFVVSTDQTPSQAVTEALEHIGEDKIIGMVLNKSHRRRSKLFGLGYGYGSGYGYGYGYGYGEKGRAGPADPPIPGGKGS
jgi:protein-tyrosine kinase